MSVGASTSPGRQAGGGQDSPQPSGAQTHEMVQQLGGQAEEMAQELGGQAQEMAQRLGGQAQEMAQQAAGQAKGKVREQLDQRCSQVAEQIHAQASDLRAVSEALRQQDKNGPARAAEKLAEYAQNVGSYLREKDAEALLSDAEDVGRRQPFAAGAGALALGFAASRFLKASSAKRYAARSRAQSLGYPPAGVSTAPVPPADGRTGL